MNGGIARVAFTSEIPRIDAAASRQKVIGGKTNPNCRLGWHHHAVAPSRRKLRDRCAPHNERQEDGNNHRYAGDGSEHGLRHDQKRAIRMSNTIALVVIARKVFATRSRVCASI
jgi:hypothetical protein